MVRRKTTPGIKEYLIQVPEAIGAKATILAKLREISRNQYIKNAIRAAVEIDMDVPSVRRKVNRELAKLNGGS